MPLLLQNILRTSSGSSSSNEKQKKKNSKKGYGGKKERREVDRGGTTAENTADDQNDRPTKRSKSERRLSMTWLFTSKKRAGSCAPPLSDGTGEESTQRTEDTAPISQIMRRRLRSGSRSSLLRRRMSLRADVALGQSDSSSGTAVADNLSRKPGGANAHENADKAPSPAAKPDGHPKVKVRRRFPCRRRRSSATAVTVLSSTRTMMTAQSSLPTLKTENSQLGMAAACAAVAAAESSMGDAEDSSSLTTLESDGNTSNTGGVQQKVRRSSLKNGVRYARRRSSLLSIPDDVDFLDDSVPVVGTDLDDDMSEIDDVYGQVVVDGSSVTSSLGDSSAAASNIRARHQPRRRSLPKHMNAPPGLAAAANAVATEDNGSSSSVGGQRRRHSLPRFTVALEDSSSVTSSLGENSGLRLAGGRQRRRSVPRFTVPIEDSSSVTSSLGDSSSARVAGRQPSRRSLPRYGSSAMAAACAAVAAAEARGALDELEENDRTNAPSNVGGPQHHIGRRGSLGGGRRYSRRRSSLLSIPDDVDFLDDTVPVVGVDFPEAVLGAAIGGLKDDDQLSDLDGGCSMGTGADYDQADNGSIAGSLSEGGKRERHVSGDDSIPAQVGYDLNDDDEDRQYRSLKPTHHETEEKSASAAALGDTVRRRSLPNNVDASASAVAPLDAVASSTQTSPSSEDASVASAPVASAWRNRVIRVEDFIGPTSANASNEDDAVSCPPLGRPSRLPVGATRPTTADAAAQAGRRTLLDQLQNLDLRQVMATGGAARSSPRGGIRSVGSTHSLGALMNPHPTGLSSQLGRTDDLAGLFSSDPNLPVGFGQPQPTGDGLRRLSPTPALPGPTPGGNLSLSQPSSAASSYHGPAVASPLSSSGSPPLNGASLADAHPTPTTMSPFASAEPRRRTVSTELRADRPPVPSQRSSLRDLDGYSSAPARQRSNSYADSHNSSPVLGPGTRRDSGASSISSRVSAALENGGLFGGAVERDGSVAPRVVATVDNNGLFGGTATHSSTSSRVSAPVGNGGLFGGGDSGASTGSRVSAAPRVSVNVENDSLFGGGAAHRGSGASAVASASPRVSVNVENGDLFGGGATPHLARRGSGASAASRISGASRVSANGENGSLFGGGASLAVSTGSRVSVNVENGGLFGGGRRGSGASAASRISAPVENGGLFGSGAGRRGSGASVASRVSAPGGLLGGGLGAVPSAGPTPLYHAVSSRAPLHVIRSLIDADPTSTGQQNGGGLTPLHCGIERYDTPPDVLRLLVESDPKTAAVRNRRGLTPVDLLWKRFVSPDAYRSGEAREAAARLRALMEKVIGEYDGTDASVTNQDRNSNSCEDEEAKPCHLAARRKIRAREAMEQSAELRSFWDLLTIFVRAAHHRTLMDPLPPAKWRLLHSAVAIDGPELLIRFAAAMHPEQLRERDEMRRMPLHIAASVPSSGSARSVTNIETLVRLNRSVARCQDGNRRLPISIAIMSKKSWDGGVKALFDACPRSLITRDEGTHLLPFMLAAVDDDDADLDSVYALLRESPLEAARAALSGW